VKGIKVTQPNEDEMMDQQTDGLYVNFSEEEAASEGRDMEPLPTGKYLCTITDVDMRESKSAKNNGKPYYAIELTVVEDKRGGIYVNRKMWTNAMLFPPALYTIVQIMKAMGQNVQPGRGRLPEAEELMGLVLVVSGIMVGVTKDKNDPTKEYPPKFEPKSFMPKEKWAGGGTITGKSTSGKTASSLLS
jgi:hypothetical protein